ncbi:MAG TPA: hypothetical protein EYP24_01750 [bacterium (Candidatus Stahlbacteria)]|nr:hypothetical protein [Candidatus Stahlbacteria bacterium]
MSELLILVGSDRKKGNSETVGRLILRRGQEYFDRGELVFLRDFHLLPCNGCMACITKDKTCPLEDDFYPLLDRINQASHLIIIAPTYVLMPPARIKLLLDRYIAAYPRLVKKRRFGGAGSIVALPEYSQFQLPLLNLSLLAYGFEVMVNREFNGAGPGEVLLDPDLDGKIESMLMCLKEGEKEDLPGHCPYCLSPLLYYDRKGFICPICKVEARIEDGIPVFTGQPRWSDEGQKDHYENWILKTKDRFLSLLRDIRRRRKELPL